MKSITKLLIAILFITTSIQSYAQSINQNESVAVLHLDTKGFTMGAEEMGDITRIELSKLELYDMIDKYDVDYLVEKNQLKIENCYGKLCLVEIGKSLKVDKMLTGSAEVYQDLIVISLRLIDVGTGQVEKTQILEFLNIRNQVQMMIGITLKKMFGQEVDESLFTKLTKEFDYESSINSPETDRLSLNGPRMGATLFSGEAASIMESPESQGGMDARPLMFQFGYQFEVKYLNQGNFQALFEFIPMITGLDQGKFIPSFSFLNGMRNNQYGWEFAFGPNIAISRRADGYYDDNGDWFLEDEWQATEPGESNPYDIEKRLDSRGDFNIVSGFVFAVGKTFRSGRLNIPVNAFFIPGKNESHRFGISVGYNVSSYK
ncbi:MAG: hypothetical protein ACI8YQ_002145 [Polaribacter sp.]|jgi:hypothetical protein